MAYTTHEEAIKMRQHQPCFAARGPYILTETGLDELDETKGAATCGAALANARADGALGQ